MQQHCGYSYFSKQSSFFLRNGCNVAKSGGQGSDSSKALARVVERIDLLDDIETWEYCFQQKIAAG